MMVGRKKKSNEPTPFTVKNDDIGNLEIEDFLGELKHIIQESVKKLRNKICEKEEKLFLKLLVTNMVNFKWTT